MFLMKWGWGNVLNIRLLKNTINNLVEVRSFLDDQTGELEESEYNLLS